MADSKDALGPKGLSSKGTEDSKQSETNSQYKGRPHSDVDDMSLTGATTDGSGAGPTDLSSGDQRQDGKPWGPTDFTSGIPDIQLEVNPSKKPGQGDKFYPMTNNLGIKMIPKDGLQPPAGYNVYRDGNLMDTVGVYIAYDMSVIPGEEYVYQASAIDENNVEYAHSNKFYYKVPDVSNLYQSLKKVAMVPVRFADTVTPQKSTEEYLELITEGDESLLAFFKENSYGKIDFSCDVLDQVVLSGNMIVYCPDLFPDGYGKGCSPYNIYMEAMALLASEQGVEDSDYDVYIFGVNGMGAKGFSNERYLTFADHRLEMGTIAHEVGHTFGLWHSNSWNCPGGELVGPSVLDINDGMCVSNTYGDQISPMGPNITRHFNALDKLKCGWINSGAVQEVTEPGNYEISAIEFPANAPVMLKILLSGVPEKIFYFLEYRKPIGFDAAPLTNQQLSYFGENNFDNQNLEAVLVYLRYDRVAGNSGKNYDADTAIIKTFITPEKSFEDNIRKLTVSVVEFKPGNVVEVQISGDF